MRLDGNVTGMKVEEMVLGEPDAKGRRAPVGTGKFKDLECDTVIVALGTKANPVVTKSTPGLELNKWGNIAADDGKPESTQATNLPGVFAGGDIVTGGATVILAMGAGRRAAKSIASYLTAGKKYIIVGRQVEDGGGAGFRFGWSSPSTPLEVLPNDLLFFPAATTAPTAPTGLVVSSRANGVRIVFKDASLERAAKAAVWGAFANCGQLCVRVERVYVESEIYDEFVEKVRREMAGLRQGLGGSGVDMGRLIYPPQLERVKEHLEDARLKGGKVFGGDVIDEANLQFEERDAQPPCLVGLDAPVTLAAQPKESQLLVVGVEDEVVGNLQSPLVLPEVSFGVLLLAVFRDVLHDEEGLRRLEGHVPARHMC